MALELIVEAGDVDRIDPFVTAHVAPGQLAAESGQEALGRGPGGEEEGGACVLIDLDRPDGGASGVVAQYDKRGQELSFVVTGTLPMGTRRRFAVRRTSPEQR